MLRRERLRGFRPGEVSSQRWAAGQPALTGVTAGHPAPGQGWQGAGRAFGVHSLGKAGGEKSVGHEAVSVLLLAKQHIRERS